MNEGRPEPRFKLANSYVELLAAVRYLYQMPHRQLEGFTRTLHTLVPDLPTGDYSGLRKRILRLNTDPYKSLRESTEPVTIAVDSTGVKVHKAGGWMERVHGKKSRYVKLHFAVRIDTHEVVAMEVSTDDTRARMRRAVELVKRLGYDGWARLSCYGRRWAVETAYSTFKRVFGEGCMAKTLGNIARSWLVRWRCIMCWLVGEWTVGLLIGVLTAT